MKGTNWMLAGIFALGTLLAQSSGAVTAPAPGNRQEGMLNRVAVVLDLTDAQKTQAQDIFAKAHQAVQNLNARTQMQTLHQQLADAVKANDKAKIATLTTQGATLRAQMMAIRLGAAADLYQILTPEQKAKADKLHGLMMGGGMRGHRMGGPGF